MNYSNQGGGQNNRGNNSNSNRYDDRKGHQGVNNASGQGGRGNNRGNLSHWNNDQRNDMGGFQNKRRRF